MTRYFLCARKCVYDVILIVGRKRCVEHAIKAREVAVLSNAPPVTLTVPAPP